MARILLPLISLMSSKKLLIISSRSFSVSLLEITMVAAAVIFTSIASSFNAVVDARVRRCHVDVRAENVGNASKVPLYVLLPCFSPY